MPNRETSILLSFGLTRSGHEHTFDRTRDGHTNYYTTETVQYILKILLKDDILWQFPHYDFSTPSILRKSIFIKTAMLVRRPVLKGLDLTTLRTLCRLVIQMSNTIRSRLTPHVQSEDRYHYESVRSCSVQLLDIFDYNNTGQHCIISECGSSKCMI